MMGDRGRPMAMQLLPFAAAATQPLHPLTRRRRLIGVAGVRRSDAGQHAS